jgi:hypothetical protein
MIETLLVAVTALIVAILGCALAKPVGSQPQVIPDAGKAEDS